MDKNLVEGLKGANLLVAGEVGIDEYIWGETRRISPEAPVPVVEVRSSELKLGLAANVAQNVVSLGGQATLVSVRGSDADGDRLEELLGDHGIRGQHWITDETRPTLRKTRIIAQKQHVVRVDYERSHSLDEKLAREFCDSICDLLPEHDGVILQDYGKGLWDGEATAFVKRARELGKPVFVDPSRLAPLSRYRGVTLLTPNRAEAEALCGLRPDSGGGQDRLKEMAGHILKETQADHSLITCGPDGMISLSKGEEGILRHIPTYARDVFDVTGAGDTVVALMAMMMVTGNSLETCMRVANAAAGIVVGHIGAACVSPRELADVIEAL